MERYERGRRIGHFAHHVLGVRPSFITERVKGWLDKMFMAGLVVVVVSRHFLRVYTRPHFRLSAGVAVRGGGTAATRLTG